MIFDNIQNLSLYQSNPELYQILEYMSSVPEDTLPENRVVMQGTANFVNPVSLSTKPESECMFEAHRIYSDVHFILTGCEKIVVENLSRLMPEGPFSEKNDIGFYNGSTGTLYTLHPGDFLVCDPVDAHKVAIMSDAPAPVTKLVGKIKYHGE